MSEQTPSAPPVTGSARVKRGMAEMLKGGVIILGEALRRITEGAAMIRSKGEAGTGDVSNATTHMRQIRAEIRRLSSLPEDELYLAAKELQAPYELVKEVAANGKLPVVLFTAGGIATPADAAMMMQLGA